MKFSYLKIGIFITCFLFSATAWAQTKTITGKVTSNDGSPLPGVTVLIKGNNTGTQTDAAGAYSIDVAPGDVLDFSFVGFDPESVKVGKSNKIDVSLKATTNKLGEVVVVGYGTQKRIDMTSSIATISPKTVGKEIGSTVGSLLQGQAAGVDVLQPGGIAGADVSIVIRGAASFGDTDPLYIIDGAFSNSSLDVLDPNDIESIEVLKDAAAAAIYGSRAANGVIIITTKSGQSGIPKINFSSVYTIQSPEKYLDYMNTTQYLQFRREVAQNSGIAYNPPSDGDTTINTDWQKAWLSPAPMYKVNVGLSGGSANNTYNMSLGYLNQDGMTTFSGFKRYDFRLNNSFKRKRLSIHESFGVSRQVKEPTAAIVIGPPIAPIFDKAGNYTSSANINNFNQAIFSNPLAPLYYSDRKVMNTFMVGSLNIGYKILDGLEYNLTGGGSYNNFNNLTHTPVYYTLYDQNGEGVASYGNNVNSISETRGDQFNYNIDNTLSYKRSFHKHFIDALLGTSWLDEYYRSNSISSINDLGAPNITGTGGTVPGNINASSQEDVLLSFFSRLNYSYDSKYLLSASIRNDISSKFANGNRSGWFPSLSAGWNVQRESWFKNDIVSELKLRASYGELGANFIDPYQFNNSLLGPLPSPYGMTLTNFSPAYVAQLYPANLQWETAITKDVGIDLGFFKNALTLTVEYFNRVNKNLLAQVSASPSSGQGLTQPTGNSARLVPVNSASVQNKGMEFTLGYNKSNGDFTYNISGNLSFIRNKVLSLGQNVPPILGPIMSSTIGDNITITEPGYPIGSFYGFKVVGLTDDGQFKIQGYDANGNPTTKSISDATAADKTIIGNPYPNFTYGFNFSGAYKKFDFTLFIQGVKGGNIFNQEKLYNYFEYDRDLVTKVLNSWTSINTNTGIPLASTSLAGENGRPSTFYIEDGSYFRLKNLQVGYTFDFSKSANEIIKNLRIFAGIQNLFTITKYSGYDPEVSNNTTFTRNVDSQNYPNSRIFTVGLNSIF